MKRRAAEEPKGQFSWKVLFNREGFPLASAQNLAQNPRCHPDISKETPLAWILAFLPQVTLQAAQIYKGPG